MMISIIIPNWNGERFLKTCFDSIFKQTYTNYEVIMVDDCSTDNSVNFVRKHYPGVVVIPKKHNSGFPSSVNIGIKAANGKLIALLNNDTELDKDWLKEIQKASINYPKVGFFASKMIDFKNRKIIDSCGDGMTWSGRSYKIGELEEDGQKFDEKKYVFGACAGAAVYRKELFDKIGLFDEDFGFYLEDVDIDFRAQLAGFQCLFIPTALVYHIGAGTAGKKSKFSFKMMIKNHFHVIYKNYPAKKIWLNLHKLFYSELRFAGAAVKYQFIPEYFWGLREAMEQRNLMKPKRKKIQSQRKVDYKYLDKIIEGQFEYSSLTKAFKIKE